MARWQGTTASRGYGWKHVCERNRRLALWRPGDPCARCGRPMMVRWLIEPVGGKGGVSAIDLGHTADRTGWTGLEHRSCNRAAGARVTNRRRGQVSAWRTSRQW